jgi:predicted cobalt transporter CbtA
MGRVSLAVIAVFVAWSLMDFMMHGVILASSYAATQALWRPMNEMKVTVMYVAVLIAALCFVLVYVLFFSRRGVSTGLRYGLLFGVGVGVSMGYGSYSVMPIPYHMALTWFLGTVVEAAVGGAILGAIVREEGAA